MSSIPMNFTNNPPLVKTVIACTRRSISSIFVNLLVKLRALVSLTLVDLLFRFVSEVSDICLMFVMILKSTMITSQIVVGCT